MSSHSVIEALKQKLLNEQKSKSPAQQSSPYSRSRRDDITQSIPSGIPKPSSSGTFGTPLQREYPEPKRSRDTRESNHHQENKDPRGSRYDERSYQIRREPYDRYEVRSDSRRDERGSRDQRGQEERAHVDDRRYRERDNGDRRYRERHNGDRRYRERDSEDRRYRERTSDDRRYRERDDEDRRYRDGRSSRDGGHHDRKNERSQRRDDQFALREQDLANAIPLDRGFRESFWDIKPKGFEKVSSERAKISGLFPLPGEARRIDVSKLEGLVKSGDISSQASILFEETKIDSLYSRISKQLIVTGVEFTLFPVDKLIENLKNYIASLNLEESYLVNHELFENKQLVLHLSNSNLTTVLYASELYLQKELNLKLRFKRPESYITPIPEKEEEKTEVLEEKQTIKINDSGKKISILNVPNDIKEDELLSDLEEIDQVNLIELINDSKGEFTGIVFVEFANLSPGSIIESINKIVINQTTLVSRLASSGLLNQEANISYRSFSKLVQNDTVIQSKVLILLNAIEPESLRIEENYKQTYQDIKEECSNYGYIESIKIPKPQEKYKRNLKNIHTSVGKIFVKFSTIEDAKKAAQELNGKQYIERTIIVSFIPESDYDLNIL